MSVVVYLRTDPHHVAVSQGVKVLPSTFVPPGQDADGAQHSIDVVDGQGETIASCARDEVVGYYVRPGRNR